jgi:hypothetical protein
LTHGIVYSVEPEFTPSEVLDVCVDEEGAGLEMNIFHHYLEPVKATHFGGSTMSGDIDRHPSSVRLGSFAVRFFVDVSRQIFAISAAT